MEKSNQLQLAGTQWFNNPRQITKDQFQLLKDSLAELGDLSGVVHDLNSNQYVGGNQRSLVFENCEFELTETFETPTRTGTVALGFIIFEGEKYAYRRVRWDLEQCRKALILANAAGGSWDMEVLANEWDDLPLFEWGVPVPKTIVELGEEEYTEKEITSALETQHTCPSCGFGF